MTNSDIFSLLDQIQSGGSIVALVPRVIEVNINNFEQEISHANKLNNKNSWQDAANIFYSLYKKIDDPILHIKAGINLAQVYINVSSLDKAEMLLDNLRKSTEKLSDRTERFRLLAALSEKQGWISDCREVPNSEIRFMKKSLKLLENIDKKNQEDKDRILTIEHFLGRAYYKKYIKSGNPQYLNAAEKQFQKNLVNYNKAGNSQAVAFNQAWLARVEIQKGNIVAADKLVKSSKARFNNKGHYFRIAAEIELAKQNKDKASEYAILSLKYTLPPNTYHNGTWEAVRLVVRSLQS